MEEIGNYEHFTRDELIQIIVDQQQMIHELSQTIKVSGGFRSQSGASQFAQLLSLTQTLRKQHLPILASLTAVFKGQDLPLFLSSG
jgi:hypothetical protein